jgi:hypothetical protein
MGENNDTRLEQFWVDSGNVWHEWQPTIGGSWSNPVRLLPGAAADNVYGGTPSATLNCPEQGKLHVYAIRKSDGHLVVSWQLVANAGPWHDWYDLGGILTSNPDAVLDFDGRMEVFARGANGSLYTRWQTTRCGGWSAWTSLGGQIISYPTVVLGAGGLHVVRNRQLRLVPVPRRRRHLVSLAA